MELHPERTCRNASCFEKRPGTCSVLGHAEGKEGQSLLAPSL